MFRRIELIYQRRRTPFLPFDESTWLWNQESWPRDWQKTGLNTVGPLLNIFGVKAPTDIRTVKSVRFFFTEKGWKQAGRPILQIIKRARVEHRVLSIKEKSVDVIYRDEMQVVVRPRKARNG